MLTLEDVLQFVEDNKSDENTIRTISRATDKLIKGYRQANKNVTALAVIDKDVSNEALILAKYMSQEVKKRYPWYTPRVDEWATDIDRIHKIGCIGEQRKVSDRFDWGTIKTVTIFSQQDPFWQQQVRSGANLRKHFNKLLIATKTHFTQEKKSKVAKI